MKTLEENIEALAEKLFTEWAVEMDTYMGYVPEEGYHQEWLTISPEGRKCFVDKAKGYATHFGLEGQ